MTSQTKTARALVPANDNHVKQASLPTWLTWQGTTFPSSEAWEYIENDFHHGQGHGEPLPVEGAIMEFSTLRGRPIFAAIIPDAIEYDIDWNTGERWEPDYVREWHLECYSSKAGAEKALKVGLERADHCPNDDDGTYGIPSLGLAS